MAPGRHLAQQSRAESLAAPARRNPDTAKVTAFGAEIALSEGGNRTALGDEREAVDAVDLRVVAKGCRRVGKAEIRPAPVPQLLGVTEQGHELRALHRCEPLQIIELR